MLFLRSKIRTLNVVKEEAAYFNFKCSHPKVFLLEGCLTVHLPHEIMRNANLMQKDNFIDIFLARHVSGTHAHHQEH